MAIPPNVLRLIMESAASPPPPGHVSNFVNPENQLISSAVAQMVCFGVATVVVAMRLYTKLRITKDMGWDDYTAFLAWTAYAGANGSGWLFLLACPGVHIWDIQVKTLIKALYYLYICGILYNVYMFAVKVSILLLYLKIFVPIRKISVISISIYIVLACHTIFYTIGIFISVFHCYPREKIWNPLITEGHCLNLDAASLASGIINVISDFVLLLLPQHVIWKLQMPLKRKLQVSAVFLIGILATMTSIFRLQRTIVLIHYSKDPTYDIVVQGYWTSAEVSGGILCACLPVLPPLFQNLGSRMGCCMGRKFSKVTPKSDASSPKGTGTGSSHTAHSGGKTGAWQSYNRGIKVDSFNDESFSTINVEDVTLDRIPREQERPVLRNSQGKIVKTVHIQSAKQRASTDKLLDLEKQQKAPWV